MQPRQTLSLTALTCLVVGSMVGGGIFSLPQVFGETTGVVGALIAWAVSGIGMVALAFVFVTLSRRRPDIDAGIYGYAQEGFGNYIGFIALVGYWASACSGNVTFLVLSQSTLGAFFPVFGEGNTPTALICASVILWLFHFILLRGVKQASFINVVVTVAKVLPLILFLAVVLSSLHPAMFEANLFGGNGGGASVLFDEVGRTMPIAVFVFLGIEGATVYSRLARKRDDVGRATLIGFLIVLTLLVLVSVSPFGILPRARLATLHNPSAAGVLASIIGLGGHVLVSLGVLVSVLGAFLAWSLLAAEVLFTAARQGILPAFLARENGRGAPAPAIWCSTVFAQLLLLLSSMTESAFRFAVGMTSCVALIPYLFVVGFGLKLIVQDRAAGRPVALADWLQSIVAAIFSVAAIIIGGRDYLFFGSLLFAVMTVFFIAARRERRLRIFSPGEALIAGIVLILALVAAGGLGSRAMAG